jgi:hypothetical protein
MKNKFARYVFTTICSFLFAGPVFTQCAGGVEWVNGANTGGVLRDTGSVLVYDTVYVQVTNPSFGSFATGRPGYSYNSTTWAGYDFEGLYIYRGGGLGASTRFKLKIPLDSNSIHFRLLDVRGDISNREEQRIRGYLNGVQVSASFKDVVNGATVSGDVVYGATSTTSTTQSSIRIFFNNFVDSVVITSAGSSDYIGMELLARCDLVLQQTNIALKGSLTNNTAFLQWNNVAAISYELQRADDGVHFYTLKNVAGVTSFLDEAPLSGYNYYRLKLNSATGVSYSNVVKLHFKNISAYKIYPNPARQQVTVQPTGKIKQVFITDLAGRELIVYTATNNNSQPVTIPVTALTKGIYIVTCVLADNSQHSLKLYKE